MKEKPKYLVDETVFKSRFPSLTQKPQHITWIKANDMVMLEWPFVWWRREYLREVE